MLSIFRRKKNDEIKKQGNDQSFSTEELLNETEETAETEIETALSLHPNWNLPAEQHYVFRFLNNELKPLKPNQISLSGIEINEEPFGLEVTAFIRNSLQKAIQLQQTVLLLLDENNQIIARHTFDLSELDEIPGKSSRPWVFIFPEETLVQKEFNKNNWTLAFELKNKHVLDLEESWQQGLSEDTKKQLEDLVNSIDPPKDGEINVMGLQVKLDDSGSIQTTIFIRNGTTKNIQLQQLPLQLKDASGEIVAQGGFTLDDLEIKANTTKPWTFIFPKENVLKENPDFSSWMVIINQ